jgi:transcriptional regulator with XRE-family HTH domain
MRKTRKIDANAIIERIRELRREKFGKRGKSEFARRLGLSVSTYNYYEQDRLPPVDVLAGMCEVTGVSLKWLIFGEEQETGEKEPSRSDSESRQAVSGELISKIEELVQIESEAGDQLERFADLLLDKAKLEKESDNKNGQSDNRQSSGGEDTGEGGESELSLTDKGTAGEGLIPVLGRTAAGIIHFWDETMFARPRQAVTELEELVRKNTGKSISSGYNGMIATGRQLESPVRGTSGLDANLLQVKSDDVEKGVEFIECPEVCRRYPNSFALKIDGDSMSPRINDGDIVILSPSVPAGQGQICVAKVRDQIGVTCKIIRLSEKAAHLIPVNEKYESRTVGRDNLLWSLAVLGCFRT